MPPKRVLKASAAWFNDIKRYSDWDADTFRTWQREMNDACAVAALDMEEEKVDVVKARTGGVVREAIEGFDVHTVLDTFPHIMTEIQRLSCPTQAYEKSTILNELGLLDASDIKDMVTQIDRLRQRANVRLQMHLPNDIFTNAILDAITRKSESLGDYMRSTYELDNYDGLRTACLRMSNKSKKTTSTTVSTEVIAAFRKGYDLKKKPTRPCKHCNKKGHWDKDCWSLTSNKDKAPASNQSRRRGPHQLFKAVVEVWTSAEGVAKLDIGLDHAPPVKKGVNPLTC